MVKKKSAAEAAADDGANAAVEEAAEPEPGKKVKKGAVKKAQPEKKAAGGKGASDVFLERISNHSAYFDNLVDLFPARVYFTAEDTGDEGNRFRQKASDRAQAKKTAKENSKKAKRLKLDPDTAKSTSTLVKERAEQEEARSRRGDDESDGGGSDGEGGEDDSDDDPNEVPKKRVRGSDRAKPELQWRVAGGGEGRDELMARLQKRIEEARAKRNAEEQTKRVQKAQQWRADTLGSPMPGQKTPGAKGKKGGVPATPAAAGATPGAAKTPAAAGGKPQPAPGDGGDAPALSVQFGRVDGLGKEGRREKKRKRATSVRDPAAALEKIEAAKAEVEAAGGKQSAEGQKMLHRQSWSAALARATGEKVLDDPRLLKKSIKRAEVAKRKSAAAWKERVHNQTQGMEQRQQKRKDNLQGRVDDKAAKAVERREKKLMRPGFEGRLGGQAITGAGAKGGGAPGMK